MSARVAIVSAKLDQQARPINPPGETHAAHTTETQ